MPKAFFDIIDETPLKNNTGGFLGEKIIDLVIPKYKGGGDNRKKNITLDDVFKYYQREEKIDFKESNSNKAIKSIKIKKPENIELPDDLIFSLKRFGSEGFGVGQKTSKIKTYVDIKDDIEVYNTKYYISAVIIHTGLYGGGHYYIYVKSDKENMWIKLDDDKINLVRYSDIKEDINTNGYIFLYKNKYYKFNKEKRNGIKNIGNSCYFNSILQLLISTDEYLNINKMQEKRRSLYDFLTGCTKKSKSKNINDGEYLRTFNLPNYGKILYHNPKTNKISNTKPKENYYTISKDKNNKIVYIGVSAFAGNNNKIRLKTGCEEDAHEALGYILDSELFPYKDNIDVYCQFNTDQTENNRKNVNNHSVITRQEIKKSKINNKSNCDNNFTMIPPFYKYIICDDITFKKDNKKMKNIKYSLDKLNLNIFSEKEYKKEDKKEDKKDSKKKVIKKYKKIKFDETKNVGEISKEIFDHINKHLENIGSIEPENPILKELSNNQINLNEYTKKLLNATIELFENIETFKNDTSDYNKIIDEKEKIIAEKIKKISILANDVFSS